MVIIFFVQENARSAFVNLENSHHYDVAGVLAGQVALSDNIGDVQMILSTLEKDDWTAFVLSDDGSYLAHADDRKINGLAADDFSPDAIRTILTERDGLYSQPSLPYFFAFTPVPGREAVAVIAARDSTISALIRQVQRDSFLQILVAMLIVFVASGAVIWLLIGLPVRRLTDAAEQLSAGKLEVQVVSGDMIDELGGLATTFNTMGHRIRELVENLEQRVKERTAELTEANVKLEAQNNRHQQTNQKLTHEIAERRRAELRVQRQLAYGQALAGCSQTLLAPSGSEADKRRLLAEALQHLVEPARASKVFLYENFHDPELGFCSRFIMDVCAPGIPPAAEDPNSLVIPWSVAPDENRRRLEAGEPVGGPVKRLFAAAPPFRDHLLNKVQVQSVQFLPIHFGECWWGYVGFDDRTKEREWGEDEILLLGTAAEMLSSTLQRWQAEQEMREARDLLELRVRERTADLDQTITLLQQEMAQREQAEAETQQLLGTLEQRVATRTRQLATFFDVITLAGGGQALAEVLEPVLARILEISAFQAVCVHLLDQDNTALQLAAHHNLAEAIGREMQAFSIQGSFARQLRTVSDPIIINDLNQSSLLAPQLRLAGYQAYLGAQIRVRGRPQGLLSCYNSAGHAFSLDETSLIAALAELMGVMVENHRLRELAEELAVLEERQRLARNLHDSVSQALFSQTLFARSAREAATDDDSARLTTSLAELETGALNALREMRLLLYELRPLALEEEGLPTALRYRLETVERRVGLKALYKVDQALDLPPPVELEMYYIAIEALNNVLKHAAAGQIVVRLAELDGQIRLEISDDGCGFDPEQVSGGMGLTHLRERMERLKGTLEIRSAPGAGTDIRVAVERKVIVNGEL
jgi:nitrate/nitrite-specific signal transduction histidine kinase